MLKFNELVEGVEYWLIDEHGNKSARKYKKSEGLLYVKMDKDYTETQNSIDFVLSSTFEECEWTPKVGERYYYPHPMLERLYNFYYWNNVEFDKRVQHNVGIYRTSGEAIAKAKELGWE